MAAPARAGRAATRWLTRLSSATSTRSAAGAARRRRRPAAPRAGRRRVARAVGRVDARSGTCCRVRLALDPDAAAHQLDELRRDRQAEAGAAEPARGRAVGLRERLEDRRAACPPGCRCRCRATANVQRRAARPCALVEADVDVDRAALGELDRVADEVDQHLPQPDRIADDARRARRARRRSVSASPFCVRRAAPAARRSRRRRPRSDERRPTRARACRPRSSRSRGCR